MIRLFLLFALGFWHIAACASAPPLLLEQAFLRDPGGAMKIEEASASTFKNFQSSLGLGFESGAIWIRLKVAAPEPQDPPSKPQLVVRIGPNNLERIDLYAAGPAGWRQQTQGALQPRRGPTSPDDMHSFVIEAAAQEVYLRIEHQGFLIAQIEVLSADALPQAVAKRVRALTISMVMALGLLALGLAFFYIDRSVLLLAYCSFQLGIVLFLASNAGLMAHVFPDASPQWLNRVNGLVYVLRVAMTCWLIWAVLQPHKPGRAYVLGAKCMLGLCGVNALLVLAGQTQLALRLCLLVFSIIPFWQLYGIWAAGALPPQQRRILTVGCLVYIVMLVLGLSINFTDAPWLPTAGPIKQIMDWRLNGFAVGVVFFWITMLEHSAQKRVRAQEVESLRHQALQARSRQAELDDRSALIDMLTHELKNPLATVRFALASLKQQALGQKAWLSRIQNIDMSVRRMDDLIERVAHFSKIERITAPDSSTLLDVAALIQELLIDVSRPEQWEVHVEPGIRFCGDRQLLMVILENLMTNAGKYALPDQKIRIQVSHAYEGRPEQDLESSRTNSTRLARLQISNHVDPASLPDELRLFERYYRHPHAQSQPGMGLGLSVVKTAAQKMGAKVTYRHEDGQVFFTLSVPA